MMFPWDLDCSSIDNKKLRKKGGHKLLSFGCEAETLGVPKKFCFLRKKFVVSASCVAK